jgi:hypothetical protein
MGAEKQWFSRAKEYTQWLKEKISKEERYLAEIWIEIEKLATEASQGEFSYERVDKS